jgi:hypothetical protein
MALPFSEQAPNLCAERCSLFQWFPLNWPERNVLVHAKANLVSTGRAGVACRDEAANDVGESALVDLLSNPVLIDEVTDVHPPRIASGDGGWAYRCFACSDVLSTRT